MTRFFPLIALAALVGCSAVPTSPQGVRSAPAGTTQFEVNQNYQQVYRTVALNARTCFQSGAGMAQNVVTSDVYSDSRTAEISVGLYGVGDAKIYLAIDIKAESDDRTMVKTYYALSTWKPAATGVESMLRGGTDCRPSTS